jgi:hypothetical protein
MLKQPEPTLHKTTHTEITSLFGQTKLILDEMPKAVSPFGGLASFISFLGQIGFSRQVQEHSPFAEPISNNGIPLVAQWQHRGGPRGGALLAGGAGLAVGRDVASHGPGRQRFL